MFYRLTRLLPVAPALLLAAPALLCAAIAPAALLPAQRVIPPGPVAPTWPSLEANYRWPEWFRDARFGIWAHGSAQSVPEGWEIPLGKPATNWYLIEVVR